MSVSAASRGGRHGHGALAAVSFTVSGGVVTIQKRTNVRSVTRLTTGIYRITFDQPMPDTNFTVWSTARFADFGSGDIAVFRPNRGASGRLYTQKEVDFACENATGGIFDPLRAVAVFCDGAIL